MTYFKLRIFHANKKTNKVDKEETGESGGIYAQNALPKRHPISVLKVKFYFNLF